MRKLSLGSLVLLSLSMLSIAQIRVAGWQHLGTAHVDLRGSNDVYVDQERELAAVMARD